MAPTVALTGATGFIGGRVLQQLCDRGWRVRALVRNPERATRLLRANQIDVAVAEGPVELIPGSLEDRAALERLMDGVDAVVHCAGAVRGIGLQDFERTNVAGVRRVVDAAVAALAQPRLLVLSSLAAREPRLSHYAASKRHGEQVLEREDTALEWLALRPPAVYGPGDKELLPLFRWMQRGVAPIVGSRHGRFSMLFVDDLAAAIETWLSRGHGVSGVFELHDGRRGGYSWDDVVAAAAALRGGPVHKLPVPGALLRLAGAVGVTAARVAGFAPMLSPGKVRELRHDDWVCSNGPLRQALPWGPQVTLDEGLRRTLSA